VAADWAASRNFDVELVLSAEQTDVEYGYDEDWTNTQICEGLPCDSELFDFDWWYSSTDNYSRDRDSLQLDVRLVSSEHGKLFGVVDWVLGAYAIDQNEDLVRDYLNWDIYEYDIFTSRYDTERTAVYGELAIPFSDKLTLSVGGRVEDFSADYSDSRDVIAGPDETLWGGEVSLEYQLNDNTFVYGLISRGFKAGGVNGEALGKAEQNQFDPSVISFLQSRLEFETETANNLEIGLKGSYWQDRWQLRLALFAMERNDVQLKGWYNENQLFVGYIDNGAEGDNRGLELETSLDVSDEIRLFGSLGLLDTEIKQFYVLGEEGLVDKSGRDQAHAPSYQYNVGIDVAILSELNARVEVDGKDEFYFSDSHDQKSDSYQLVHASLNYALDNYHIRLWGRNLIDEDYAVRGFYFPNDPREFYEDDQAYIQLGDPRTYGITATYNF
jgi:outer membrane receptor protein involved in Fe transport